MKWFYLPGPPLNLTCDKALTENVLMMKPCWLMCSRAGVRRGSCERSTFFNWVCRVASAYPLALWVAEYQPYRRHRQNNYSRHRGGRMSSCLLFLYSSRLLFFLADPPSSSAFVNRWLIPFSASSHSVLFWSLSIPTFLSLQTGDSLCLRVSAFALFAISQSFSLQKGDHPLSSSTWSELPATADWWIWEGRGAAAAAVATLTASSEEKHINGFAFQLKCYEADPPFPPALPIPWRSSLVFLKCQRQSWIGQDNKHLNKALSLINERWRGLGKASDCLAQIKQWMFCK